MNTSLSHVQSSISAAQTCIILQLFKNQSLLNKLDEEDEEMEQETLKVMEFLTFSKIRTRVWRYPFSTDWWDETVPNFPERLFIQHFRVNYEIFDYLVLKLNDAIKKQDTRWRVSIPVRKRIAVALKLMATTCDYLTVAALFGIGRSSAHRCFTEFVEASYKILVPKHITFPKSNEQFQQHASEFEALWQFPMVFGAIDGSHIPFRPPSHLASDFYNYKGWHSVILLAICDAQGKAMWIKSGIPGRQSDSGAFKETTLFRKIVSSNIIPPISKEISGVQIPLLILGDSGFGLDSWLIKPFTHHTQMNLNQKLFNSRLSRARRIVENLFGRVKGRWRRLYRGLDVSYKMAHKVIDVAVALHNICEDYRVSYNPTPAEMNENEGYEHRHPQPVSVSLRSTTSGDLIRQTLMETFILEIQPWDNED